MTLHFYQHHCSHHILPHYYHHQSLPQINIDNCPLINNSYSHPDNYFSNIPPTTSVSREISRNSLATTMSCLDFDVHVSLTPTCHLTSTPLQPIETNQDNSPYFLIQVRAKSCSRGNFAANLNRLWYSRGT